MTILRAAFQGQNGSTEPPSIRNNPETTQGLPRILVIEDNPGDARLLMEHLRELGLDQSARMEQTLSAGRAALAAEPADVILVDLGLPDSSGLHAVRVLHAAFPEAALIALTGQADLDVATQAIQEGAQDFLLKDSVTPETLERSIRFSLQRLKLTRTIERQLEQITENRRSLEAIFDAAPVPMLVLDRELAVVKANSAATAEADRARGETYGQTIGNALCCLNAVNDDGGCGAGPNCESCALRATVQAVHADNRRRSSVPCELPIDTGTGRTTSLLVSVAPINADGASNLLVCLQNMTEFFAAERRVERLNRLLRTAYEIGLAIRRVAEPSELLRKCCRTVVVHGGYVAAWVAAPPPGAGDLRVVAAYGIDGAQWQPGESPCTGDDGPCGAPVEALERQRTVIHLGKAAMHWRERTGYAIRGIASLPLTLSDETPAVLSVASLHDDTFDPDSVQLLEEVASDLSHALRAIMLESERQRIEDKLRASEERHRKLVERNVAGVFRTSPDGEILLANEAMARIFGFDHVGQLLEVNASDLYADQADRRRLIEEYLALGEVRNFEVEMRTVTGESAWVLINAMRVPDASTGGSFIEGTMLDITDTRNMADQLHHSQRMEAVGRLAGGVAHEFNNLLQAMSSTVEGLISRAQHVSGDSCTGLEDVSHLIERGSQVARQLLVFSRRETTTLEAVPVHTLVPDMTRLLRRLLRESIELKTWVSCSNLVVDADRGQLEQVLVNLALNAQDAMPATGRLEITADRHHDLVRITVRDNGSGIPAEFRDRIFEPFFTTKGTGSGTGLGLSVVHGIVTRFGGTIEVDSRVGAGTTFTIQLPESRRTADETKTTEQTGDTPDHGNGETILLVEDEDAVREGLTAVLEILGYRYISCSDVTDVDDDMLRRSDLVLSDLVLPGGSGLDLCREIQANHPDLPVILMSGYSAESAEIADLKGTSFLQKPFSMAQVGATIARQLRRGHDHAG
jgi:two-component system cell cycle sensor histidine kinase/response regulator CckA